MIQPADGHVHTEFSWDAPDGSMERTCARAVRLGLPAVAFTEHVDYSRWSVDEVVLRQSPLRRELTGPDGVLVPPELDQEGYLASVERCRELFPALHVISGVELGEPHWNAVPVAKLLGTGHYERVLGSLHALPVDGRLVEANALYRQRPAVEVMRLYLAEIADLIVRSDAFAVLAHLDYAMRGWPAEAGPFDLHAFEDEFRYALRALAASDRTLEVNTRIPLASEIVRWWREEGGKVVTFGSDAHVPDAVGTGLSTAVDMVEAFGFRPGRHPYDRWTLPG
ncbi:PHP domain-containing protein [Paractinoplanes ferrugineus]|uniref:Histidinol-phosphatase n=1 Tax=Paractinoplanes ferrugineus TaxID=113564 RepID=A0A919MHJ6_9ACTN|nr:PHP domain-containing protein [Actinoplanes ferrugineus]GIE12705.1 histidinol-phosphatase [Actinoplanes ferrugineus]